MQDLTTGSLTRHLLKTTSFLFVSMIFQTLYVLVDMYWVSRLGTSAVAAVAVSGNLMFIVLALTQMLSVGTTTLVSHAVGRKDQSRAGLVFNQSQVLSLAVGLAFFTIAMMLRTAYANRLSADAATAVATSEYLAWFIPAMGVQFAVVSMAAALRGVGNFKTGMVVQITTVVLNMVFAPVLMFGWGFGYPLGIGGAALATFLSILIGVVWLSFYFTSTASYLRFKRDEWRPQLKTWSEMLKVGLPAGAEFGLMSIYLLVVYIVSRPFGAAAQAGFGIGLRVIQACFLPVLALGFAVAPVAGQNFGARNGARVKRTFSDAALLSAIAMFALSILAFIRGDRVVMFFSSDPEVIAVGGQYLRIAAWNFVASGIVFVSSSMFQAMGNTIPSLATSFVRIGIVCVPTLVLASMPGFQLRWVWYLSVLSVVVQMTLNLVLLRREFQRRLNFV